MAFPRSCLCFAALLAALAGCQGSVQKLDALNPPANDFASSLASEYQAYAGSEAEQGHKPAAEYFAAKGLKALHGEAAEPDKVDAHLPPDTRKKLEDARLLLLSLLTDDLKHVAPQKAARAQLLFDCWQNQLAQPPAHPAGALCAEEFKASVTELQDVADSFSQAREIEETLHFADKDIALDAEAQKTLSELADKVKALPPYLIYSIELDGHPESYHEGRRYLAAARVQAVKRALAQAGIPDDRILADQGGRDAVVLSSDDDADNRGNVDVTVRSKVIPEPQGTRP